MSLSTNQRQAVPLYYSNSTRLSNRNALISAAPELGFPEKQLGFQPEREQHCNTYAGVSKADTLCKCNLLHAPTPPLSPHSPLPIPRKLASHFAAKKYEILAGCPFHLQTHSGKGGRMEAAGGRRSQDVKSLLKNEEHLSRSSGRGPTVDGMLGGYGSISNIDLNGSKAFLQKFLGSGRYDVIWIQWVIGHLTDDHLVDFLQRCQKSLRPNGLIVIKDNVSYEGVVPDDVDSSVCRDLDIVHGLVSRAGLSIVHEEQQMDFPKEIYQDQVSLWNRPVLSMVASICSASSEDRPPLLEDFFQSVTHTAGHVFSITAKENNKTLCLWVQGGEPAGAEASPRFVHLGLITDHRHQDLQPLRVSLSGEKGTLSHRDGTFQKGE
ncbi:hypothetical protein F7725_015185 [Dissostichus mawsoni]|uniref:protein N-terminal methyltransferase n=1 Tax=Dissostichus mawsoni TaxID=36200 RepID=A0A7J5YK57_DISMA|nr:hypothetical protein F7725_015185 [Dissostichus mawsoni]